MGVQLFARPGAASVHPATMFRNFILRLAVASLFMLPAGGLPAVGSADPDDISHVLDSVVSIQVDSFQYNYAHPWNEPEVQKAGGTGFIIDGKRILTNAHVVSGAVNIRVRRPNQTKDYEAHVAAIGHDCDLAMLQVEDPGFFRDASPLEIGDLPALSTPVVVAGFPIGGNRVSITRGVVSRLDMDTYSHSGVDAHLTIQVDAAINPGNSGGPAFQRGRVIGVAFQGLRGGDNIGYLIPPVVVRKFLKDVSGGEYRGYTELGIRDASTENPVLRRALGIPAGLEDSGVLVVSVVPGSSADGSVLPGDVLFEIQGQKVSETGEVVLGDALYSYVELVDHLSEGERIRVRLFRQGKTLDMEFPARRAPLLDYQRKNYDHPPRYYLQAGLVFQPLDANLMGAFSQEWTARKRSEIFYSYFYRFSSNLWKEKDEEVILTTRINDPVNLYSEDYLHRMVEAVNGRRVRNFSEFASAFDTAVKSGPIVIVTFRQWNRPLVLRSSDVREANARVRQNFSLSGDRNMGEEK